MSYALALSPLLLPFHTRAKSAHYEEFRDALLEVYWTEGGEEWIKVSAPSAKKDHISRKGRIITVSHHFIVVEATSDFS